MTRTSAFFGFTESNERLLRLAKTMMILMPFLTGILALSSTFHIIFIAEALGGGSGQYIQGLALVSILLVIQLVIQTIFDYPTGSLGDHIGHRYVLCSAYLCFGLAFFLTSIVVVDTPFPTFILIYLLIGIGGSQESGAWHAWFDNNFRVAMPGDEDRKQYGIFQGRFMMLVTLCTMIAIVPGSVLAALLGRPWVFQLEAIVCVIVALLILRLVQDFEEVKEMRDQRPKEGGYVEILKSGVRFLNSDPLVKWLIIGSTLSISTILVWSYFIIFPLFYIYMLTDVAVASFRTIIRIPGIFTDERSGVWSQRFEPRKWIPRFQLIQNCGFAFYLFFALLVFVFQPLGAGPIIEFFFPNTDILLLAIPLESFIPVILMFIAFSVGGLFYGFTNILTQRVLIDIVPSNIRNSVYSLMPTVTMLFAIPQILIIGPAIENVGFIPALVFCAVISGIGVLLVRKGLSYPMPILDEAKQESLAKIIEDDIESMEPQ
ncbi:MAG: MFS transporter [Candidatus Thorarchaeota archaeon]